MNKEMTVREMDMIRSRLHDVASDIIHVGRYSDHVYQAKHERYSRKIDEVITDLLKDELKDVRS